MIIVCIIQWVLIREQSHLIGCCTQILNLHLLNLISFPIGHLTWQFFNAEPLPGSIDHHILLIEPFTVYNGETAFYIAVGREIGLIFVNPVCLSVICKSFILKIVNHSLLDWIKIFHTRLIFIFRYIVKEIHALVAFLNTIVAMVTESLWIYLNTWGQYILILCIFFFVSRYVQVNICLIQLNWWATNKLLNTRFICVRHQLYIITSFSIKTTFV